MWKSLPTLSIPVAATLVPVTGKPTEDIDEHETDDMGKTVGIAVGCAGAYIILVVGLMIYCKGRRARQAKNKLRKYKCIHFSEKMVCIIS